MKSTELKKLRGTHDQTMRCGIVDVVMGTLRVNDLSPTARFLELMIREFEMHEHSARMDALVED